MDDLSPQEIEKLILGYEELNATEKAVANSYLDRHPELAARLQWHREKEKVAANMPFSDGLQLDDSLLQGDEDAQQESLRRILADLYPVHGSGVAPASGTISFAGRLNKHTRWALPLAAVLALAVLLPRNTGEKVLLWNLSISQVEVLADGSRGPVRPAPAGRVLHTGQAFVLDFNLTEDAFVVVYHVDPKGKVSRVYPETITENMEIHHGGRVHQIPGPDSGETWVLGAETGVESFLVASSTRYPGNFEVHSTSIERGLTVADLKVQLEEKMDQVDLYEFDHQN